MRNPTAPMLLLQVALESLGNLVGGGCGSSESWAREWNNRANLWGKGLTLGQLPFHFSFPFSPEGLDWMSTDLHPSLLGRAAAV